MKRIQVIIGDEFHRLLKTEASRMGLDISDIVRQMTCQWLLNPEPLNNEHNENFVLGHYGKKQNGQATA
jgi:hypothetical protein